MRNLSELSVNELKNAIWDINDMRCPGPISATIQEIRQELLSRGESPLGYHEEPAEPVNPICVQDCSWCEKDEAWVPLHECRGCREFRHDEECSWCSWEKEAAS